MFGLFAFGIVIILVTSFLDARLFKDKYGWIRERKYFVRRSGERNSLELTAEELLVGDVVLSEGDGEFQFWFGSVLAG